MRKRILALDVGTKSCGLAITDENRKFAFTVENIFFESLDFDFVFMYLKTKVFTKYTNISLIIIGMPTLFSGALTNISHTINEFAVKLREFLDANKYFDLKIKLVDENYSSKKALELMISQNVPQKKRKTQIDMYSALIILNEFLNFGVL